MMNIKGKEVTLNPEIKSLAIKKMRDNPTKVTTGKLHAGGCYCVLGWIAVVTQEILGIGKFVPVTLGSEYSHYAFTASGKDDGKEGNAGCFLSEYIQRKIFNGLPQEYSCGESPCMEITRIGDNRQMTLQHKLQWLDANL